MHHIILKILTACLLMGAAGGLIFACSTGEPVKDRIGQSGKAETARTHTGTEGVKPAGSRILAHDVKPAGPGILAPAVRPAGSPCWERTLEWGEGPGRVGLKPKGPGQLARGAAAVAVGKSGRVFVLDSLNRRVLAIARTGSVRVTASGFAAYTHDMTVGPDGAMALANRLHAKVWVFDAEGRLEGELALPRVFRHVKGLRLGQSRRVSFSNAYQETLTLGSPAAPMSLAAVLRSKKEGAFMLDEELGVQVRVLPDGNAQLLVIDNGPAADPSGTGREQVRFSHRIEGPLTAIRLVGLAGAAACMKVETLDRGSVVSVHRRAICLDTATGAKLLDTELASPGLYLPRRELAAGGDVPVLAFIHPAQEGLKVRVCTIPETGGSGQQAGASGPQACASERRAAP